MPNLATPRSSSATPQSGRTGKTLAYKELERQLHLIADRQLDVSSQKVEELFSELRAQRLLSEAALESATERSEFALRSLGDVAQVSEGARGTVITLSSRGLFESGQSDLLPDARVKLTEVARALTTLSPEAPIVVEAGTEASDSSPRNLALSRERALALRAYLIESGILARRITAFSRAREPSGANGRDEDLEIVVGRTERPAGNVAQP